LLNKTRRQHSPERSVNLIMAVQNTSVHLGQVKPTVKLLGKHTWIPQGNGSKFEIHTLEDRNQWRLTSRYRVFDNPLNFTRANSTQSRQNVHYSSHKFKFKCVCRPFVNSEVKELREKDVIPPWRSPLNNPI